MPAHHSSLFATVFAVALRFARPVRHRPRTIVRSAVFLIEKSRQATRLIYCSAESGSSEDPGCFGSSFDIASLRLLSVFYSIPHRRRRLVSIAVQLASPNHLPVFSHHESE